MSTVAPNGGIEASGSIPATVLDAVQLTSGSAEEIGRDLIACQIFQRGLLYINRGHMYDFLNLLGSSVILYTSTVYVLIYASRPFGALLVKKNTTNVYDI
jgi:hypothetical protein